MTTAATTTSPITTSPVTIVYTTVYNVQSVITIAQSCPINVTEIIDDIAAQLDTSTSQITNVTTSCGSNVVYAHQFKIFDVSTPNTTVSFDTVVPTKDQAIQVQNTVTNITTI